MGIARVKSGFTISAEHHAGHLLMASRANPPLYKESLSMAAIHYDDARERDRHDLIGMVKANIGVRRNAIMKATLSDGRPRRPANFV